MNTTVRLGSSGGKAGEHMINMCTESVECVLVMSDDALILLLFVISYPSTVICHDMS